MLDRTLDGRDIGLGDLPLAALTPMRVGEWLAELQRSGLSASEHEPTILTITQVEALVANLRNGCPPTGKDRRSCQPIRPNPSLALVVELLAYGGLRIGEVLALRRRHVDVLGCSLVDAESPTEVANQFTFGPTQTHQVREVPLPRSLLVDLERHLDTEAGPRTDALLFPGQTGNPMRYRNLRRSFDAACRRVRAWRCDPTQPARLLCVLGRRDRRRAGGGPRARKQPGRHHDEALRAPDGWRRHGCRRPPGPGPTGRASDRIGPGVAVPSGTYLARRLIRTRSPRR